jgi:hypothetical protein
VNVVRVKVGVGKAGLVHEQTSEVPIEVVCGIIVSGAAPETQTDFVILAHVEVAVQINEVASITQASLRSRAVNVGGLSPVQDELADDGGSFSLGGSGKPPGEGEAPAEPATVTTIFYSGTDFTM